MSVEWFSMLRVAIFRLNKLFFASFKKLDKNTECLSYVSKKLILLSKFFIEGKSILYNLKTYKIFSSLNILVSVISTIIIKMPFTSLNIKFTAVFGKDLQLWW